MHSPSHILTVSVPEDGMKLIAFLTRRLEGGVAKGELHRWIRTGQVRLNGGRAKAFDTVAAGDAVRMPPFAGGAAKSGAEEKTYPTGADLGGGLAVLAQTDDFLALEKPAGLASQPGTGHNVSVVSILKEAFRNCAYVPAPAHRLDKATGGVLLAGKTHAAQEGLHALFASPAKGGEGAMTKAYLAWVAGTWPHDSEEIVCDYVAKQTVAAKSGAQREIMRALPAPRRGDEKEARSRVTPLLRVKTPEGARTLLRVVLETGRTHQIRVQLASRGHPVVGDGKYGGPKCARMLLHAHSIEFPWRGETVSLVSWPVWPAPYAVAALKHEAGPEFFRQIQEE